MVNYRSWTLVGCLTVSCMSTAAAMRCGDKLVYTGDDQFTILQKCGEPLAKQTYEEVIPLYNQAGYQIGTTNNVVERWIYQRSPADFQYTLIFDGGILKEINANRNPS
ncbi:DUF2845 domain-containing protein [Legionella sp. km772]|uniref:DUF2845 domain-containing protein n=1 Tax=Legionella sp. km772 TaxID=2498111 RepID=UPI001F1A28C9|nr:DUF2845 domain-containing protein [Legionella sp. km772]